MPRFYSKFIVEFVSSVQGLGLAAVKKAVLMGLELAIVKKVSKFLLLKSRPIVLGYGVEDHSSILARYEFLALFPFALAFYSNFNNLVVNHLLIDIIPNNCDKAS